jgi:magnesium transporter
MPATNQGNGFQQTVATQPADHDAATPSSAADPSGDLDDVVEAEPSLENGRKRNANAITVLVVGHDDTPREASLDDADDIAGRGEKLIWADLSEYDETDLRKVAARFGLAERAVQGVVTGWRRPHLIQFNDQFFVNVTIATVDVGQRQVVARELDCFAGEDFFVSMHKAPLALFERIVERTEHSADLVRGDSAYMLFIVLDELLNDYDRIGEAIEDEIERAEERALTENSDRLLDELLHLKRFVFAVHRLAEQHREVFSAFLRPDFRWVSGAEVEPYFRDLQAHHADLLAGSAASLSGVNNAFDIYVSYMAHRTNYIVKVLTMVSVVLLPMAAIFGLFGTNFETAGLYNQGNFWIMVASVVILGVAILGIFRWRRWF